MLYVYFGTNRQAVRDAASKTIARSLSPEGTLTTFDSNEYAAGRISDAVGANSLFGGEEWFVIDTPSDSEEFFSEVKDHLEVMAESVNTFIILEGALLAAPKKLYTKHAKVVEEFTAEKEERFNSFTLAEALANRDKRKLWVTLQQAKVAGLREEEVIGMLWWQLKALRLAAQTNSAAEAGMKDFPYNKAKRSLAKFPNKDIQVLSQSLLTLYHAAHAGERDIETALEQWTLTL